MKPSKGIDPEVFRAAKRGDPDARNEVFRQVGRVLVDFVSDRLGPLARDHGVNRTSDVVSCTLLQLVKRKILTRPETGTPEEFIAYARDAAEHVIQDVVRRNRAIKRGGPRKPIGDEEMEEEGGVGSIHSRDSTPSNHAIAADTWSLILEFRDELEIEDCRLFDLGILESVPVEQIREKLRLASANAVRMSLYRLKGRLARFLARKGGGKA